MTTLAPRPTTLAPERQPDLPAVWPVLAMIVAGTAVAMVSVMGGDLLWRLLRLIAALALAASAGAVWMRPGRVVAVPALVVGAWAVIVGIGIGIRWLFLDGVGWVSVSGLVALVGGAAVVYAAIRRLSEGLAAWAGAGVTIITSLLVAILVWTLAPALVATHVPPIAPTPITRADLGMATEEVRYLSRDGVRMTAWFVPPSGGGTVVLRHGSGSTATSVLDHARVLIRNGYGVLLTDARGHGSSEGVAMDFGWNGDADITAALDYLQSRPEVDMGRVAVLGMSMGGEEALGAIGSDHRIAAVVAEGATARIDADKIWYEEVYGARGWAQLRLEWLQYTMTALLTEAGEPVPLGTSVEAANPRPVFLIAGGDMPDEIGAAEFIARRAGEEVSIWVVPGAGHTAGLAVDPESWERRVVAFLDEAIGR